MSRGPGRVQQAVLVALSHRGPAWLSVEWLARLLATQHLSEEWWDGEDTSKVPPPSRAAVESVRRAVKALAGEGLIETAHKYGEVRAHRRVPRAERIYADDTQKTWEERRQFVCRRLLTDAEREAELQAEAESQRKTLEAVNRLIALREGRGER